MNRFGFRMFMFLALGFCSPALMAGDDVLGDFKQKTTSAFSDFKMKTHDDYEAFRRKTNDEFADFMSRPWRPTETQPIKKSPSTTPPPAPVIRVIDSVKPSNPRELPLKEVVSIPLPSPVPAPIEPIHQVVQDLEPEMEKLIFYGTEISFRKPSLPDFRCREGNNKDFAHGWKMLNTSDTNNLINDCLKIREERQLCDWAYLRLLMAIAEKLYPYNGSQATLLAGFLYSQSGYKMRFALDANNRLHLLFACSGILFGVPSLNVSGDSFYFMPGMTDISGGFQACDFSFPNEQQLSFEISRPIMLDYAPGKIREVEVVYHPDIKVAIQLNQNLIDFYNDYPESAITQSPYTKWAVYANAPASVEFRNQLYPILKDAIIGKSQREAANILLHLAESFPYGIDNRIWGRDRAFFADESWNYPLSDCEDHAVNFTRLVRDLMHLDAVLLYYPNHIASAVAFTDGSVDGDYIIFQGIKYNVCDPTVFYSNVGETMSGMDNASAVVIELKR